MLSVLSVLFSFSGKEMSQMTAASVTVPQCSGYCTGTNRNGCQSVCPQLAARHRKGGVRHGSAFLTSTRPMRHER